RPARVARGRRVARLPDPVRRGRRARHPGAALGPPADRGRNTTSRPRSRCAPVIPEWERCGRATGRPGAAPPTGTPLHSRPRLPGQRSDLMSRVFTVYNCGTCFNRERTDEVIANLAARTEGAENRDWLITDGVGSKPTHDPRARTPGTVDPITGRKDPNAPRQARLKGIAEGFGWEPNVAHTRAR